MVQVETHGQGGEALHVGAVDELLTTDYVGLEEEETSAPTGNDESNHQLSPCQRDLWLCCLQVYSCSIIHTVRDSDADLVL